MADSNIAITTLTAQPGMGFVRVKWQVNDPNVGGLPYLQLDAVEVYASTNNDRSSASYVGEGIKETLHMGVPSGVAWYYWAKARNKSGLYGDWFPADARLGAQPTIV